MRMLLLTILLSSAFLGGLAHPLPALPGDSTRDQCLIQATKLLDETLEIMRKNYYRKDDFEWFQFASRVREELAASDPCGDIYEIINRNLRDMGESHSFLMSPARVASYENPVQAESPTGMLRTWMGKIEAKELAAGIGYLAVPWISTSDEALCRLAADSLQRLIAQLESRGVHDWVIDLRTNTGGNCWPMIAGLGPLLGEGTCGYFISGREKIAIRYQDGMAWQGKTARCRVEGAAYCGDKRARHVAVLQGPHTASAGEIVAIAFKGLEGVRFFGRPSAGYTTANGNYPLPNRSVLVLSVCREADRTGKLYEGRILPDETIADQASSKEDITLANALMWLQAF